MKFVIQLIIKIELHGRRLHTNDPSSLSRIVLRLYLTLALYVPIFSGPICIHSVYFTPHKYDILFRNYTEK
jgi:hypothetical protein